MIWHKAPRGPMDICRQTRGGATVRAGPEKAESGGDSQAARVMIHPAGWEEASLDGKTLFAGFAGTHDVGCSFRTVSTRGGADPRKFGGHKRYALAEHEDKVPALVAEKPDLTITELWQKITAHGIKAGRSAVARFLLHLQLTFKKNSACRRAGTPGCQGRPRRLARDAEKP